MRRLLFILSLFISVMSSVHGQVDSLLELENSTKPAEQAHLYNLIAREYISSDVQKATNYINKALVSAEKYNKPIETAQAYLYLAVIKKNLNQLDIAKNYYGKVIDLFEKTNDTSLISKAYTGLAQIEFTDGSLFQSIKYLDNAIELKQAINDLKGEGIAYNTMGNVYIRLGENDKAIENYEKASQIFNTMGYKMGVAINLNAIGVVYENMANYNNFENFSEALKYYVQAKDILKDIDNKVEEAKTIMNIGNIYSQMYSFYAGQIDSIKTLSAAQKDSVENLSQDTYNNAIQNYQMALSIQENINDINGYISTETNIGAFYINAKDYKKALEHLDIALNKLKDIDSPPYITSIIYYYRSQAHLFISKPKEALDDINQSILVARESNIRKTLAEDYNLLTDVYDSMGNFKEALLAQRNYTRLKDSLLNEQTNKLIQEFGNKEKERQLELKESKIKQQEAENKQQRLYLYGLGIIVVFVIIFIFLIFRQYRQKKKANDILEAKNLLITEQKQEITDSIQYARYIQFAVLPPEKYISRLLNQYFILFKPRNIVSGDFYWIKDNTKTNSIMATAADCTGHGVPGAFMSLLGISFLNEISSRHDINTPGEVLDALKEKIIQSLHQTGNLGESKDGMDISFINIRKDKHVIEFSGANNPLYIVRIKGAEPITHHRKLESSTHTLYEIKPDKMPIGISSNEKDHFTTHSFNYLEGDTVFLFSDGYADQFGGANDKKFKYTVFKQFIVDNINQPLEELKDQLDKKHVEWKANNEQTDDIIIIGIRL